MTDATRGRAGEGHAIANKVGYPEKWRDYSSVEVKRPDFFGNVAARRPSSRGGSSRRSETVAAASGE